MTVTILTSCSFHPCVFLILVNSTIAVLIVLFFFNEISRIYLLERIITIVKLIVVESKVFNERRCYLLILIIRVYLIPKIPHDK